VNAISVRPAQPDDLVAVAELRWRWGKEDQMPPVATKDEFVQHVLGWAERNAGSHRCMVAVRDGVVIGMAWLAVVPRPPHPYALERASGDLQGVYVTPDERNSGIGSRLVEAVLALARELGMERVTVQSSDRAVNAYARNGFAVSPLLLQADLPHSHSA
jgi:GNAT superfamily N-acetyltransferase